MSGARQQLPLWLGLGATALLALAASRRREPVPPAAASVPDAGAVSPQRPPPFGEPGSAAEPFDVQLRRAQEDGRGRAAEHPLQMPPRAWKDILWRSFKQMNANRLLAIAGGVAFFFLLALFPAITAFISAYGLLFNPANVTSSLSLLDGVVPVNVLGAVHEQAVRIAANSNGALRIGIVVGIAVSLWSAMSGVKAVIDALNVIYGERESRSFLKLNLIALALTLSGFATLVMAIAGVVVLPLLFSRVGLGDDTPTLMGLLRWPAMLVVLLAGLAILYRYGADRRTARWQWVSVGSAFGAVTWIVGSYLFSWFLGNFANYNATYGSLGAAVGLMMWLWISAIVVLIGAQINAEIEHQTARDSTVGADKPLGARGAVMADTVGAKQE
jgi:membrane protein